MEFTDVIANRRAIRKFRPDEIPRDKLNRVLDAAMMAPSWKNGQCYRFVVVRDADKRKAVAGALAEQNPSRNGIMQAPVCVVACANPSESGTIGDKPYYLVDVGIAVEHLVLAATNEGLGTCWVGWFDEGMVRDALDVPGEYRIVALIPLGYPDESPQMPPRKPISAVTFTDRWGEPFVK